MLTFRTGRVNNQLLVRVKAPGIRGRLYHFLVRAPVRNRGLFFFPLPFNKE
jgi:hypothetical protein